MKALDTVEKAEQKPRDVEATRNERIFCPDVDIVESPEGFTVLADVPRGDEGSVEVALESGILTLRGGRDDPGYSDMRCVLQECGRGVYERSFMISEGIDRNKISATVKNGVLKIVLPGMESEKPRKISVKAG